MQIKEAKQQKNQFYNRKITLISEVKGAFVKLKKAFIKALILRYFNPKKRIVVETDASGFTISGIISQLQEDNS